MNRLLMTGLKQFEIQPATPISHKPGWKTLKVLYCAVCRTDAKMWFQGHRDLVLPRVLGHELVASDDSGTRFVVWPGTSCGKCRYCCQGRHNLCEAMKITGFHNDGGFSDFIQIPETSLIAVPEGIPPVLGCFAEPLGCVINAVNKLDLIPNERIIIYGGGTVGLLAALFCQTMGADPTVIEKNQEKISRIKPFLDYTGISCFKDTTSSDYDAVLTACPDPIALSLGIVKASKGARISFFSGLNKNGHMETNLLNLIHYKEAIITGAYGLTRNHMTMALPLIKDNLKAMELLIEEVISPAKATSIMPKILSGKSLKYILDFTDPSWMAISGGIRQAVLEPEDPDSETHSNVHTHTDETWESKSRIPKAFVQSVLEAIAPVDKNLHASAQQKIDNKTKPLGALGRLETLAVQMSLIQKRLTPETNSKNIFVFAADHGITEEGVSAYPSEVTAQMVNNFLKGGAAINVLCRHYGIDIKIIDIGVNADFDEHPGLIRNKVRKGTRNFAIEEAMTEAEVYLAIQCGMKIFLDAHRTKPIDISGFGEMGIGNTTSASAIISTITGITPAQATGRGTGVDDKGLEHKQKIIKRALDFHQPDPCNGFDIIRKIGGYEIAGITGATLAAAASGTAVVLDGVISTAAGLLAWLIKPEIQGYLISGHKSVEIAQKAALTHMGLTPVIDHNMRLGEGTGAALAIDTVSASCKIMCEMASFGEAGVSKRMEELDKKSINSKS